MGETKQFERLSGDEIAAMNKRWSRAERGPYLIVTDPKKVGNNWFVANLGSGEDGQEVFLTTDHMHASECVSTAESQAEFFAHAEPDMRTLGRALGAAYEEIDRLTGQRWLERMWAPRKRELLWVWQRVIEWRRRHQINPFGQGGWVRWWIANTLNKRRDVCWPSCVSWALTDDFWAFRDLVPGSWFYTGVQTCRQDARKDGTCYCGKFATQKAVEEHGLKGVMVIVTETVEPEDAPDLVAFTFTGNDGLQGGDLTEANGEE